MKELTVNAVLENMPKVTEFVDEQLEAFGCPPRAQAQIDIAVDELFGNIVRYAYQPGMGPATVRVEVTGEPAVILTFIDNGGPYAPLKKAAPATTRSAEARQVGGAWDLHGQKEHGRDRLRVSGRTEHPPDQEKNLTGDSK